MSRTRGKSPTIGGVWNSSTAFWPDLPGKAQNIGIQMLIAVAIYAFRLRKLTAEP